MAIIRPFNALRPQADRAAQVAAVPYDVVNTEEARALASGNPWSFLHVSRPEIDLPAGTPVYSDQVYAKALANLEKFKKECPLESEETPSLYLYRLIMGNHEQSMSKLASSRAAQLKSTTATLFASTSARGATKKTIARAT